MKKTRQTAASSQPGRLVVKNEEDIQRYVKSAKYKRDVERLRAHTAKYGGEPSPEDLEEIPALTEEELNGRRPAKKQLTIRLDADIVDWLKSKGGQYQTRLNTILRVVMVRERQPVRTARRPRQRS